MIEFREVYKYYGNQEALTRASFSIEPGEFVFVSGNSGAGKSTLLKLIAAVERPSRGNVIVSGADISRLPRKSIPYLRRNLGLIFQDQKLLTDRTVLENVMLPLLIVGTSPRVAARRARAALEKVGLLERDRANPTALAGGDQQRLAIARAIVNRPAVLLADEPTANLDRAAALRVVEIFRQFNQVGVTVLIATHDESLFTTVKPRLLRLEQGRVLGTDPLAGSAP